MWQYVDAEQVRSLQVVEIDLNAQREVRQDQDGSTLKQTQKTSDEGNAGG